MKRKSRIIRRDSYIVLTFEHDATVGHKTFTIVSMRGRYGNIAKATQKKEGSYGKSTNKERHFQTLRTPEIKTDSNNT